MKVKTISTWKKKSADVTFPADIKFIGDEREGSAKQRAM